jgi:DNA-binding beta-propeller fold protein YncE
MRPERKRYEWAGLAAAVVAMAIFAFASPEGTSRLVSVQKLPANMDACDNFDQPVAADFNAGNTPQEQQLLAELQQAPAGAQQGRGGGGRGGEGGGGEEGGFQLPNTTEQLRVTAELQAKGSRMPVRMIRDTAPTYSSIAVDTNSNEVIMTDNNLWSYRVFDRLAPTPKNDTDITPPKRIITGDHTALQFNNGLYVDPVSGDIYSVESDTGDKMERFAREAQGDESPISILHTPHRVYNIAADEEKQELFLTIEFPPQVVVYPKHAKGEDRPGRRILGNDTALDAPHGIAVDSKDHVLFVNTWGHHSDFTKAGTGKFLPPGIQVYALDANGDAKPLRTIAGDKTQLDWPAGMKFDANTGDLYIANDIGQSILVFSNAAKINGNVAPSRVIHGPSTRLRNPTGVALDTKNNELWVSNLGNSSATVYPLMADGDASPLRVIRSAEESKRGVNFGRTAAVTYDPIRQEILVPN